MNNKFWKKAGITLAGIAGSAYLIFLISPLILNPIINGYSPQIVNEIHKATGLDASIEDVTLVTTPKLTAGLKVKRFALLTPANEQLFGADDFQIKLSLLPIFMGRIELDAIQLKHADAFIEIQNDGSLEAEKYFPQTDAKPEAAKPLPIKLSNRMPDIKIDGYNIILANGSDKYSLSGDKTEITNFILNKSIKIKASGKAVLKDKEQFVYNLNILNKIMPDLDINELVNESGEEKPAATSQPVDIPGILEGLYKSKVTANVYADLKISPENTRGKADITNISVIGLPPSNINLIFKGNSIEIASNIYTEKQEVSTVNGLVKTGKHPDIDLNFKSGAEISNILKIVKELALIFDIKDLQTLSANGKVNADFNIKSNLKNIKSNGYLKIPNANLYYGLYKTGIDNINADVSLDNNNVNIKNIGFTVLNQPLKLFGTIKENAECDLHLNADKLSLKGLIVAFGQAALLKENNINSGLVSLKSDITGRLDKINPVIKINLDNINIKNIPSNIVLKVPSMDINVKEEEIEITQTPVIIDKININVSGKIKNYLKEKINLDFTTSGDINSTLKGDITSMQNLNLTYTASPSTIIIPMFEKSKMTFSANVGIFGNINNPSLSGSVNVPSLNIPEIPVSLTNMDIKLNSHILNGNASVQKFTSGGIEAENITSDFSLKGENFYLNNLKGTAFNGEINGNIIYNITNAKTSIDFSGSGMDAAKAVYGAAGIKNALSGTLDFNTKLSMIVADYNEMMKSLKGSLTFSVKNGAFGSIGRIESFLQADNIINNAILKTTVATITNAAGISDTAKFDYIDGKLTFADGQAELNPVKSSSPLLAYYIKGKYNLINGTAVLTILGRLDGTVVAKLGPIGELSANKLLGYIPKFGSLTANIVNILTTSPKGENIDAIPALSNGSTTYKDFKVVHNGILGKPSAIKSFKWLTEIDTSAIETKSVKETFNEIKSSVNEDLSNTVQSVTDAISDSKEQWNTTKDQIKNSAEELKNLFKF